HMVLLLTCPADLKGLTRETSEIHGAAETRKIQATKGSKRNTTEQEKQGKYKHARNRCVGATDWPRSDMTDLAVSASLIAGNKGNEGITRKRAKYNGTAETRKIQARAREQRKYKENTSVHE